MRKGWRKSTLFPRKKAQSNKKNGAGIRETTEKIIGERPVAFSVVSISSA